MRTFLEASVNISQDRQFDGISGSLGEFRRLADRSDTMEAFRSWLRGGLRSDTYDTYRSPFTGCSRG